MSARADAAIQFAADLFTWGWYAAHGFKQPFRLTPGVHW